MKISFLSHLILVKSSAEIFKLPQEGAYSSKSESSKEIDYSYSWGGSQDSDTKDEKKSYSWDWGVSWDSKKDSDTKDDKESYSLDWDVSWDSKKDSDTKDDKESYSLDWDVSWDSKKDSDTKDDKKSYSLDWDVSWDSKKDSDTKDDKKSYSLDWDVSWDSKKDSDTKDDKKSYSLDWDVSWDSKKDSDAKDDKKSYSLDWGISWDGQKKSGKYGPFQAKSFKYRKNYLPFSKKLIKSWKGDYSDNIEFTRKGAIVDFDNTITINVGFDPNNNDPTFTAELTGESQLLFGKAQDAIIDDQLLGTVGEIDKKRDVSKTVIVNSTSTGETPLGDNITVSIGDGQSDLVFDSASEGASSLSLESGGAFYKDSDSLLGVKKGKSWLGNNGELKSFYKLSLEIQDAPNGTLRNKTPITVESDFADGIYSQGELTLDYSTDEVIPLYAAGADGVFWTGDEVVAAKLVPGADGNSLTVNLVSDLG